MESAAILWHIFSWRYLERINKERKAYMKSLMTLGFLLSAIFLFSGCYTILLIEPTDELVSLDPYPIIPIDPGPEPIPPFPIWPCPLPPPMPPPRPNPPITLPTIGHNPVISIPSPDIQRPVHTGRGPYVSNPAPVINDNNNNNNYSNGRESGLQRGGQTDSNPVLVRNNENNGAWDQGPQRGRH